MMQNFSALPENRGLRWSSVLQIHQGRFTRENYHRVIIGLTIFEHGLARSRFEEFAAGLEFAPGQIGKSREPVFWLWCNALQNSSP
jgi:hypothetical protein